MFCTQNAQTRLFAKKGVMHTTILATAAFLVGGFFVLSTTLTHAAVAGEVVITEFMANPDAAADASGEWIEIRNTTTSAVDINGWKIDDGGSGSVHTIASSVSIAAGGHAVICVNSDSSANGGVACDYEWTDMSLSNNGDTITVKDGGDVVIYSVTYATGNVVAGKSTTVAGGPVFATEETSQYGDGDFGTPAGNTVSIATHSYPSIQSAIDAAVADDTISIAAGTYAESVTVGTPVSLVGSGATSMIQPAINQDGITITADGVIINGLKVSTSNSGSTANIAIGIQGADGVQITNSIVETTGDKAMGIWIGGSSNGVSPSSNLTITNTMVTITGEATGIYAAHSTPAHTGWVIGGSSGGANTVTAALGNPVELYDVSNSEVSYNALTTSASGGSNVIWTSELSNTSNLVFTNNTVDYSSGSQVAFLSNFVVPGSTSVTTVTVSGNTFSNWGSRGLRIGAGITGVTASQNSFLGSGEAFKNEDVAQVSAINNWWGSASGPTHAGNTYNKSSQGNSVSNNVTFVPWLGSGTDTDTSTAGFQPNTANTVAPVVNGTSYYSSIQAAIDAASADDTITVSSGVFTEDLVIPSGKNGLELSGAGTTIKGATLVADSLTYYAEEPNILILSDGVKIHGFILESKNSEADKHPVGITIGSANVEIYNNSFNLAVGSSYGVGIVTYCDDTFCDPGPYNNNVDISGLSIHNNTFMSLEGTGKYQAIYINPDIGTGLITIKNNNFAGALRKAVSIERSNALIQANMINTDLDVADTNQSIVAINWYNRDIADVDILGNVISGFSEGIRLAHAGEEWSPTGLLENIVLSMNIIQDSGIGVHVYRAASGVLANSNIIMGNTTGVQNSDTESLDATKNYWGDLSGPTHVSNVGGIGDAVSDNVLFDPWFNSAAKTALSDGAAESPALTSTTSGQAELPSGETALVLTNDTLLNLTSGLASAVGSSITVGGTTLDLASFTSGNLAGINMAIAKIIGDISVTVEKAVKLKSGTGGTPITLTNSSVSNASVEIPDDTTVMAPAGWGGSMQPPKAGSSAGTAPSGFAVGSTVMEMGDPNITLLFDKPVKVTLSGVTGSVAYKPAGSSAWNTISTTCNSATDSSNISFPGECSIQSGNDTIIWTYHFTSFANITAVTPPSTGGGGGTLFSTPDTSTEFQTYDPVTGELTIGEQADQAVPAEDQAEIGATETTQPEPQVLGSQEYANGTLLRASDKKIYVVVSGRLRHIASLDELRRSYAGRAVRDVAGSVISAYPKVAGEKSFGQGQLIRGSDKKVYVITTDGGKRHVLSLEELARDHFRKPIHDISDSVLAQY